MSADQYYVVASRDARGDSNVFHVRDTESFELAMEEVSIAMHQDGVARPVVLALVNPVIGG